MSVNKVRIRHNETGDEAEVVDTSVEAWKTVGWTPVEDEVVTQEPNKPAPPADVQVAKVTGTNGGPAAPDTSKKE